MKRKETIRTIALTLIGIVLIMTIALIIHIATIKPKVYDNANMQISRIDFQEPLDSAKMKAIHRNLKTIPGFINDSYDLKKGVLVYFHDNRISDSKKVYNELMSKGNYKATRFILPEGMASKQVCPVMEEGSFSYQFSKGIQRIFN